MQTSPCPSFGNRASLSCLPLHPIHTETVGVRSLQKRGFPWIARPPSNSSFSSIPSSISRLRETGITQRISIQQPCSCRSYSTGRLVFPAQRIVLDSRWHQSKVVTHPGSAVLAPGLSETRKVAQFQSGSERSHSGGTTLLRIWSPTRWTNDCQDASSIEKIWSRLRQETIQPPACSSSSN